ncbi:L-ascorbate metabolism protein UlaG, beta-lactamase superfamily [Reichenbachiella agariperforans]|uniref:L-ascorbate metabolism protein UlaG, beta-lactamase superfamily n=1 Tax=Reichenbachiella agariperforans TaxID=156994 RepID=A0A1M6SFY3_REIAG|nr:MBL fold metallo-hydrolase [Reichenbachiella agariperforans]SHK43590.1 L-ascorbate metabolism protein UlaG, beta-lactamase superfamily [Reichenbachiella agariperforans]
MLLTIIGSSIALLAIGGFLFVQFSPEFGGKAGKTDLEKYAQLDHYENGSFVNLIPTSMDMGFKSFVSILRDQFKNDPKRAPVPKLHTGKLDSLDIVGNEKTRVTWFGHSALLLEIDGAKIMIDPMLGDVPAPHPWLGKSRFVDDLPIAIEKLPHLDAVIISHDHYDHLDYGSIKKLKDKVDRFYVPLGVDKHLVAWGVEPSRIEALDWWDETKLNDIHLAFTPSRHFSGRGLTDRNASLWGSWVIKGKEDNIYFSGDGGYGPHFKEIGEKYGPFDFAMVECGQYDPRWRQIHMMPEESVMAGQDVQAKVIMPIHWGAFVLAFHDWRDPVQRAEKKAIELGIPLIAPQIGLPFTMDSLQTDFPRWWDQAKALN